MAFELSFSACLNNCCEALSITDTTGVSPTVTTGWEQNNTNGNLISGATITAATITVNMVDTDYNVLATIVDEYDVLGSYGEVVTGDILFSDITPDAGGSFADGLYDIIFTITDVDGIEYTTDIKQFFYCQVKCCVNKMISEIHSNSCDTCNLDAYIEKVNKASVILDSINALASVACLEGANNMLALLQDICEFNNCNCG